jgi:xanthine dehydrogenase molybdopterin-binding subunit B
MIPIKIVISVGQFSFFSYYAKDVEKKYHGKPDQDENSATYVLLTRKRARRSDLSSRRRTPNTAMRAFGNVQGKFIVEKAIDNAAFSIGMQPEDLRKKNFYEHGDVTPFGQALSYCYMKGIWNLLKEKCNFAEKRAS